MMYSPGSPKIEFIEVWKLIKLIKFNFYTLRIIKENDEMHIKSVFFVSHPLNCKPIINTINFLGKKGPKLYAMGPQLGSNTACQVLLH